MVKRIIKSYRETEKTVGNIYLSMSSLTWMVYASNCKADAPEEVTQLFTAWNNLISSSRICTDQKREMQKVSFESRD